MYGYYKILQLFLLEFIDVIASAGASRFAIHARKAWLKGLNPKQNRTIPPLQYERVVNLNNISAEEKGVMSTMSIQSRIETSGINGDQMIDILEEISENKGLKKKYQLDKPKGVRGRSSNNDLV